MAALHLCKEVAEHAKRTKKHAEKDGMSYRTLMAQPCMTLPYTKPPHCLAEALLLPVDYQQGQEEVQEFEMLMTDCPTLQVSRPSCKEID